MNKNFEVKTLISDALRKISFVNHLKTDTTGVQGTTQTTACKSFDYYRIVT